jgi:hypothetical protein
LDAFLRARFLGVLLPAALKRGGRSIDEGKKPSKTQNSGAEVEVKRVFLQPGKVCSFNMGVGKTTKNHKKHGDYLSNTSQIGDRFVWLVCVFIVGMEKKRLYGLTRLL